MRREKPGERMPDEPETESRVRQQRHQVKMRQGLVVASERQLTKDELDRNATRRRKQIHQGKLRGGL